MLTSLPADRVVPSVTVSKVSLPANARALSTLARIDYTDAFRVDAGVERTPEQWVHAMLQDAPFAVRARLVSGWIALGLKLGAPWSQRRVLGWTVRHSDADVLLLAAGSRFGLQGELLVRSEPGGLLFATFAQLHTPMARAVWARITTHHQQVVRSLLIHAAHREARRDRDGPGDVPGARRIPGMPVSAI